MHEIRHFKPTLYLVMLLGLSGYSLAAITPGLWVFGTCAILLHAWLSSRGKFRPMSRLLANLVTIVALLYVVHDLVVSGNTPVLVVGEFLVLLQLVKLWEQRTNRDSVQLLVLGLLLMVSATISTASLFFCLLLGLWLLLALYCCLLFHLKVEADRAGALIGVPAEKFNPDPGMHQDASLPRSVRRLTVFAAAVGLVFGAVVFVVFPRGTGGAVFGQLQWKNSQALVGFTDDVSFQNVAKLQQNNDVVAYVTLEHNGQPVNGTEPLLLRGTTLDRYSGDSAPETRRYRWFRSEGLDKVNELMANGPVPRSLLAPHRSFHPPPGYTEADLPKTADTWAESITLRPTGTNVLFSIAGANRMRVLNRPVHIRYFYRDGVLESIDRLNEPIEYQVVANGLLPQQSPALLPDADEVKTRADRLNPRFREFASRAAVSGSNDKGALASQRDGLLQKYVRNDRATRTLPVSTLDEQIATNIEQYLKTHYTYTLDLTDTKQIEGRDPLIAFLYDFKKGHCEYFAGAMTLLCQSLGLQARMVVGFHCDPDSYINGYYLVQQSHAHAWVEVLTTDGKTYQWKTFDPTSGNEDQSRKASLWQRAQTLWDYLDFTYAKSVVAYDSNNQNGLFQQFQGWMLNEVISISAIFDPLRRDGFKKWAAHWFQNADNANAFWTICRRIFIVLSVTIMTGSVTWFSWERLRLRRRAARIGISTLPMSEQMRLAKQLGFYDELLRLLGRHRMIRNAHQTPLEFSRSLLFLPGQTYDTIVRLTQLFYRIRFGGAKLSTAQRRHLSTVLDRLTGQLSS